MFIDKKLKGAKAVQTLSRLHRTASGKTDTFILDFANKAEDIQGPFKPYFDATQLSEPIDVNMVYDMQQTLMQILYSRLFELYRRNMDWRKWCLILLSTRVLLSSNEQKRRRCLF